MISKKLTILGVGNMGAAIASGLLAKKTIKPDNLILFDPANPNIELFKKQGADIVSNIPDAIKKADVLLLAVKPQIFSSVLPVIKEVISDKQLIISIAAGVEIQSIKEVLGAAQPVVRVMPNLCATVGESMSMWVKSKEVTKDQTQVTKELLASIGQEEEIDQESLMNAVTAVSGSGPAYIFYLTEMLEESAKQLGIPTQIASKLARQTVIGSAKLLAASEKSAEELRSNVTSKGGTTEAAINNFEKNKLKETFIKGLKAAHDRAKELNS